MLTARLFALADLVPWEKIGIEQQTEKPALAIMGLWLFQTAIR
jgi:hypothetical protein